MGRRRTGASLPAWRSDDAAITRQLRSDSEALRYAEWWVRRRLYGLSDQEARWLHAQYVASYRVMQAALAEALADERGPLTARRARLLGQIEAEMDRLTREVGAHLLDTSVQAYQQGAAGRAWALDMATNPDVGIHTALLPTEAIRAAILTPYLGQQWGDTLALERDEFVLRIKRSLTASLVQGEGMAQAQRRLRDELGIQTDRRKGFKRNFYRTLLIARTEIMRASNLGALAVYEQNQDVLSGWEWVATRDERTCPRCGALDGKRYAFGDPVLAPPSGSHPGCRCTAVPVLRDTDLMDRVAGVRETYAEWAAKNGIDWQQDGALGGQRTSDAHGLNTVTANAPPARVRPKVWDEAMPREMQAIPKQLQMSAEAWSASLSEAERSAVETWTGLGYRPINKVIQGYRDPMWDDDLHAHWQEQARLLAQALTRAPATNEVVWRGINLERYLRVGETAFDYYARRVGTTEHWNAFASASLDPVEAAVFAQADTSGVVFEIRSTRGRYIDPVSRYGAGQQSAQDDPEFEVLFSPGSTMRIVEVKRVEFYDPLFDSTRIRTLVIVEDITDEK